MRLRLADYSTLQKIDRRYLLGAQLWLQNAFDLVWPPANADLSGQIAVSWLKRLPAAFLLLLDCCFGILRDIFWAFTAPTLEFVCRIVPAQQLLSPLKSGYSPRKIANHVVLLLARIAAALALWFLMVLGHAADSLLRLARAIYDIVLLLCSGHQVRRLSPAQRRMLEPLFGDSLIYPLVRLSCGCSSLRWLTPHAAGNVIYLPGNFSVDHPSSEAHLQNMALLFHEATHVWQHHNGGGSYMHRALLAQLTATFSTGSRGAAYDWRQGMNQGLTFNAMNPEQQAQLVQEIAVQMAPTLAAQVVAAPVGTSDKPAPIAPDVLLFDNPEQQKLAVQALRCLQLGRCL